MKDYKDEPEPRHTLPNRRPSENLKVRTKDGHTIHLTVGYDPKDTERPREIFYSAGFKSGSQLEFQVQDACVLISLLLQHGLRPADIVKSLAREEAAGGQIIHASVIGLIVDQLASGRPE